MKKNKSLYSMAFFLFFFLNGHLFAQQKPKILVAVDYKLLRHSINLKEYEVFHIYTKKPRKEVSFSRGPFKARSRWERADLCAQ